MFDKKKIAQTIVKQFVEDKVPDVDYDASLGFEACAQEILTAIKDDDVKSLAQSLSTLGDLILEKTNYQHEIEEMEL